MVDCNWSNENSTSSSGFTRNYLEKFLENYYQEKFNQN